MKKFLFILCLSLLIVNCKNVQRSSSDFDDFDSQKMNEIIFSTLNTIGTYSYIDSFPNEEKIYKLISENSTNLSMDSLIIKINEQISIETEIPFLTIIDSIKCVGIQRYDDIVRKCFDNWSNPLLKKFENVGIINYYNEITNTVYVVCLLK